MKDLSILTDSFKLKYEKFILGCDSIELDESWGKDANGEMDVFYENEILSVILSLIIADGTISEAEVRYLNDNFGLSYSVEQLKTVYTALGDEIDAFFERYFKAGYQMLQGIHEKLATAYKELFELICQIIVESDGRVSEEEKQVIAGLTL